MSVTVASLVFIVTSRSVVFFLVFSAYNDAEFVSVAWRSRSVPARVRACAVEIGPSIRFLPTILSRETLLSRYSITYKHIFPLRSLRSADAAEISDEKLATSSVRDINRLVFVFRVIAEQVITAKIVVSQ